VKKRILIALVVILALAATASLVWANGGLVSYWPFDEGSGTTAFDAVNGNHGTIYGAAAYAGGIGIAPIPGNVDALTFDGVDDFVQIAHSDNLDMTGAYAISAWVYVTDVPDNIYRPILFRGTTDANDIEVYVQALSQDLVVAHNRGNGGTFDWVRFADPPIGTLFHLGVTFNGTDVQAYYNAVPATVNQNTTAMIAPLDTNKGWWIGKVDHAAFGTLAGGADINLFKGLIDEVGVWNRALSADEVAALSVGVGSLEWLPPIILTDWTLNENATLPIKFQLYGPAGNLITDDLSADLTLTVTQGGSTFPDLRFDTSEWYYIANFRPTQSGLHTAIVSLDGAQLGSQPFVVDEPGKGNGKGRGSNN